MDSSNHSPPGGKNLPPAFNSIEWIRRWEMMVKMVKKVTFNSIEWIQTLTNPPFPKQLPLTLSIPLNGFKL